MTISKKVKRETRWKSREKEKEQRKKIEGKNLREWETAVEIG